MLKVTREIAQERRFSTGKTSERTKAKSLPLRPYGGCSGRRFELKHVVGDLAVDFNIRVVSESIIPARLNELLLHRNVPLGIQPQDDIADGSLELLIFRDQIKPRCFHAIDC